MLRWAINSPVTRDGYMGLELAGSMLSRRPVSRRGDDLVIWSLLIGFDNDSTTDLPFKDVDQDSEDFCSQFWKTFVGNHINTGFFMPSTPRLTLPGFTWAPRTASCQPDGKNETLVRSYFDGMNTKQARITDQGIVGEWMMYEFDIEVVQTPRLDAVHLRPRQTPKGYLQRILSRLLGGSSDSPSHR